MKKNISKKIPGGKLLRIKVSVENQVIDEIEITGDFFIYPEEALVDIEKFLVGKRTNEIGDSLADFLVRHDIEIIGFKPADLQSILENI